MRRIKFSIGLAVVVMLATAGIAIAKHNKPSPRTDAVNATFSATRQSLKAKACIGADGDYVRSRAVWTGTIAGDPRLTGDLTIRVDALDNQTTGLGTSKGVVKIRNRATGAKANLKFRAVDTGDTVQGLLTGRVHAIGGGSPLPKGELVANFQAAFSSETALSGELGATGDDSDPAVVQSGKCPGHGSKGHNPKHQKN